jgi:L-threonylcarbamoyladenylate synthase
MESTATDAVIAMAAAALARGELVGMPTETVYGLAADARNPAAIRRIFTLKGRPADHPLIVHLADASEISQWARDIPPVAYELARRFWPGPLTLILQRASDVSDLLTGGQSTVGLRVPAHPVARALLHAFGGALAAPSANRFGRISPTTAAHVREDFGSALPLVLEGGSSEIGLESTIVDLSDGAPRVLRPGAISLAQLAQVLGALPVQGAVVGSPRVSGALASHYAPRAPARMATRAELLAITEPQVQVLAVGELPQGASGLALPADAASYGRGLYAALRSLDERRPQLILIEVVPAAAAWWAVRDRLQRATHPS